MSRDLIIDMQISVNVSSDYYAKLTNMSDDEITSWNTEDHVVCPNCKSFDYYIIEEVQE